MRYTASNAADKAILNEYFYRDVIKVPKPTEKQPTRDVPNVKRRSHWTTIHLRILRSPRQISHKNWLALKCHLELHGSHRPKVVAGTALGRIHSWRLHDWLSKMRTSKIGFPSMLQLRSPTITRMGSIQSLTKQQPSLRSPRNGIR
jgi:hypothetical protein